MPHYSNKKQTKIAYEQAESGFINIEKWEPPFMEVEEGFGYIGVLAEDSVSGKLQCHVCGKWFEQLPTHFSKHGFTGESYREKFGLLNSTALKSKRIRLVHSSTISRLQKEGKMQVGNSNGYGFTKKNKESANRKGKPKAAEARNGYGVCDLQIVTKIIALARKLGKTPTLTEVKDEYGQGIVSIMHSRYGSYVKYCREYLKMEPNFSNYNPRFGSDEKWKEYLIDLGVKSLEQGKKFGCKTLLPANESRYVYRYFKGFKDYKKEVFNKINKK